VRSPGAGCAWRPRGRAHCRNRAGSGRARPGDLPDLGRGLRAAADARAAGDPRAKAGNHETAAGLRGEYPRDQHRPEAHLPDQGRTTGAPGLSGRGAVAAAVRRDRRRPGRDRLGADGARCVHVRGRQGDSGEVRALGADSRGGGRANRARGPRRDCGDSEARRPGVRAHHEPGGREQPAGRGRGGSESPGIGAAAAGAFDPHRGGDAGRGPDARGDGAGDPGIGAAGQAAGVPDLGRRDHGHPTRGRAGWKEPGIRARRSHRPCGQRRRGGAERRHGRHRRADGRRGGHRRRGDARARRASGPGRAAEPGGKRLVSLLRGFGGSAQNRPHRHQRDGCQAGAGGAGGHAG
jgi:hypothetical protein